MSLDYQTQYLDQLSQEIQTFLPQSSECKIPEAEYGHNKKRRKVDQKNNTQRSKSIEDITIKCKINPALFNDHLDAMDRENGDSKCGSQLLFKDLLTKVKEFYNIK